MAIKKIGVCGAGTMGAGIAQVFAQHGFETILFDVNQEQLEKAQAGILSSWKRLVEKGKLTEEAKSAAGKKLTIAADLSDAKADLIIEAVVEGLDVKSDLFSKLSAQNSNETILVSNTSSLSITQIAAGISNPERFAGMHFFNPAPVMKLVEIIGGSHTANSTIETLKELVKSIGKNPVVCKDSPGFIVNRVARHFYVESLKIAEEQVASFENADALLESAGFKMGAFKLMDVIGNDINFAVTNSLFQAFHGDAKFRPSRIQEQKVKANQLGVKTGEGFYRYSK
ncbi:MAG: 3-hydroxyacyl-CoA dehydrogenase NAD-binding domain-containing protein [Chitinophagales bacterium]|nr:3-hydroxybutyryl-CoA dehydrogenase [Chitinophagales bacterium]MCO5280029.1 3-hydroxyacyl-CoA dehydrogenase NAD-binding domain-containing protein [Chitinophagales bacterium]OJV28334.1 MAG: 3-hydroxybutyryl-CoA dehydrogenase [Bacteroidetes bacterium 37-13]HRN93356.1 3-hydroxyacyl-CoA dehydrogenase NAD-binding domain-containing protein [Chitinophagales bacterium]HRP38676.1 3-hydroxyacyl-CoA dehydrogenase NAD-binding domain-containing protein [Chitinophagales bacterium]